MTPPRSASSHGTGPPAPPERPPTWVRRAAVVLGALAVLALAVRALLPTLVDLAIRRGLEGRLGLPSRVDDVDLALWRGEVAVDGLVVGRPAERGAGRLDPDRALVVWRAARARLAWGDLLRGRVRLLEVALDGPVVRLVRAPDGRIESLAEIAAASAPSERDTEAARAREPAAEEPGWPVAVDRLALRDARLALADAARDGGELAALAFEALELEDLRFENDRLTLGSVALRGPELRLQRRWPEGAGGAGEPAEEPAASPAARPAEGGDGIEARVERVAVEGASVVLLADGEPLEVRIDLEAREVTPAAGATFPVRLDVAIDPGTLSFEGDCALSPLGVDGRLAWQDLPVPALAAMGAPALRGWVRSARASGELAVRLETAPREDGTPPGLRLAGSAALRDVDAGDPSGEEVFVRWRALDLDASELWLPLAAGDAARLRLARVRLDAPALRWTQPASALDALRADLGAGEAAPEPGAAPVADGGAAPAPDLRVEALELRDGEIELVDRTVSPALETRLRELDVDGSGLRGPTPAAERLAVRGLAPDAAPFSLDGRLAPDGAGTLDVSLERLSLPPLDAYARAAGYTVERGQASLSADVSLTKSATSADARLVLHRLDVAALDPGVFEERFGVSLPLALALLRDPAGDIALPVPVRIDQQDADVALVPVLRGALQKAILAALQSPLRATGAVLGRGEAGHDGDAVTFEPLAAAPGSAELTAADAERLDALARLLASRPSLGVELRGRVAPDEPAGSAGAPADVSAASPDPTALARARAEGVADRLRSASGVDPEQVRLGEPADPGTPGVVLDLFVR